MNTARAQTTARPAPRVAPLRADPVRSRTPSTNTSAASSRELQELRGQVAQSDETIRGLEKERDFYFNKLRDIEILVQQFASEIEEKSRITQQPIAEECDVLVKDIQAILYSTEVYPFCASLIRRRDLKCRPRKVRMSLTTTRLFKHNSWC
jgi:RP/EB family microtubule-associated protein